MGFSVLSLLEILYYGSLRLCCTFYRRRAVQNHSEKGNKENNGENNIQSKASKLSHYPKPAWFSQPLNQGSDQNKIGNNNRIFIRQKDHDYDYYGNNYNEYIIENDHTITPSENQSFYLPGSFEDQLHRAFVATAFPEKRHVRVLESN